MQVFYAYGFWRARASRRCDDLLVCHDLVAARVERHCDRGKYFKMANFRRMSCLSSIICVFVFDVLMWRGEMCLIIGQLPCCSSARWLSVSGQMGLQTAAGEKILTLCCISNTMVTIVTIGFKNIGAFLSSLVITDFACCIYLIKLNACL